VPEKIPLRNFANRSNSCVARFLCDSWVTCNKHAVACSWCQWSGAYPRGIKRFITPQIANTGLNNWSRICC